MSALDEYALQNEYYNNPIKDKPEHLKDCPTCHGEGTLNISDCCGAEPYRNGDGDTSDIGICPDCGEHCSYGVNCETCEGTGKIEYEND